MKYKACPECSQDLTTCPTDCQPEWIPSPRYRNRNSSPGTNRSSFSSWYNSRGLVKNTGQKIRETMDQLLFTPLEPNTAASFEIQPNNKWTSAVEEV
jgi:hypothetical protein